VPTCTGGEEAHRRADAAEELLTAYLVEFRHVEPERNWRWTLRTRLLVTSPASLARDLLGAAAIERLRLLAAELGAEGLRAHLLAAVAGVPSEKSPGEGHMTTHHSVRRIRDLWRRRCVCGGSVPCTGRSGEQQRPRAAWYEQPTLPHGLPALRLTPAQEFRARGGRQER
jgi:hypothetical protein